jgi:predicted ferric reductase
MCWTLILSTRVRFIENYFGGMDKVYQIHKRIGRWAFYIILFHPLFLAMDRLPQISHFLRYMWFQNPEGKQYIQGLNVGIAALILMTGLVALTLWLKPPYHIWKKTHEWFGVFMLLVAAHVLMVQADIAAYPLLTVWMYFFIISALSSFIYIRFLYRFLGPRYEYTLARIEKTGDILDLTLSPRKKPMDFKPSQFIYLVVNKKGITKEPHPYSIACGYNLEGQFKLGIKQIGDHTRSLSRLAPGDALTVYGPYGKFSDLFLAAEKDCVFIGGGIGITPFLGMWHVALHSEERLPQSDIPRKLEIMHPEIIRSWKSPRVSLFYVCRHPQEAGFDADIKREVMLSHFHGFSAMENRGHHYECYISSKKGRISADYICRNIQGDIRHRYVFLCGPWPMVKSLMTQFHAMGVKPEQIIVEDFNLI